MRNPPSNSIVWRFQRALLLAAPLVPRRLGRFFVTIALALSKPEAIERAVSLVRESSR